MNANDAQLRDELDVQAAWLGMEPPERTEIDTPAREGDVLQLGPVEFQVLATPGHTQGSISLWIPAENKLVAGDTLFRESIGRTDLPGGNGRQIEQSIRAKLYKLPDDATVIAGHGDATTIGHEKRFNPFVRA
jgi:hydroxyacylglutathione hydrolase